MVDDDESTARIPWDVLVALYDRIPVSPEEQVGDFALVALRVTELYEAAKAWQDEITNNTMISFRGGKRRAPSLSPTKQSQDTDAKIEIDKMQKLAKNPVLSKVRKKSKSLVIPSYI